MHACCDTFMGHPHVLVYFTNSTKLVWFHPNEDVAPNGGLNCTRTSWDTSVHNTNPLTSTSNLSTCRFSEKEETKKIKMSLLLGACILIFLLSTAA